MTQRHEMPLRNGFYALTFDRGAPGCYRSTPVVAWDWEFSTGGRPVTMIHTHSTAVLCPSGTVTDWDSGEGWDTVSEWVNSQLGDDERVSPSTLDPRRAVPGRPVPFAGVPKPVKAPEAPKLRDLGVSGRACAPLERMGVKTLGQLALYARETIESVKGVSRESMDQFDELLPKYGLDWSYDPGQADDPEEPAQDTDDDDIM